MSMRIKTIIFDLGGVLINLDFQRSIESFMGAGIKNINNFISDNDKNSLLTQYRLGLISTSKFRDFIREEIGKPITDQEIDNMWNKMLLNIPHEKLDLLIELHKKYTLLALSNTNELHWEYCLDMFKYKGLKVDDFFDNIFLSFKMHKEKPNPEIYEEVIKEANITPNESLFIDDSLLNCNAASKLGINVYHYHVNDDLNIIKSLLQ